MGKFGAIYVSLKENNSSEVQRLSNLIKEKGYLFTVRYHHQSPWMQLSVDEPETIPDAAKNIASYIPDERVIGLGAYTVSDSVIFCEYKGEKVIRLLQSGFEKERQWERIEGEPQEWESEILGDREVAIGKMGIVSYDIQKIGVLFNLPGFGIPSTGEPWTIEIIN